MDIPLNQLYRLAAHLMYWQKARIIDTLSDYYVYVVSPRIRVPIAMGKFSRPRMDSVVTLSLTTPLETRHQFLITPYI